MASADSKVIAPIHGRVLTAKHLGLPTKRLLRTDDTDAEERAFGVSSVKELISKMKLRSDLQARLKQGESVDDVGKSLILDDTVRDVLSNPNVKALEKYITMFNEKNPENRVSMIDVLTRRYGEAEVSKMLITAKGQAETKELATKLQAAQVAGWYNRDKSALAVFKILKLDDARNFPFKSRNLEAWENYANILGKRKPKQATTMFDTFRKAYDDAGLAKLLEMNILFFSRARRMKVQLFDSWRTKKYTSEDIERVIFKGHTSERIKKIISDYGNFLGAS